MSLMRDEAPITDGEIAAARVFVVAWRVVFLVGTIIVGGAFALFVVAVVIALMEERPPPSRHAVAHVGAEAVVVESEGAIALVVDGVVVASSEREGRPWPW